MNNSRSLERVVGVWSLVIGGLVTATFGGFLGGAPASHRERPGLMLGSFACAGMLFVAGSFLTTVGADAGRWRRFLLAGVASAALLQVALWMPDIADYVRRQLLVGVEVPMVAATAAHYMATELGYLLGSYTLAALAVAAWASAIPPGGSEVRPGLAALASLFTSAPIAFHELTSVELWLSGAVSLAPQARPAGLLALMLLVVSAGTWLPRIGPRLVSLGAGISIILLVHALWTFAWLAARGFSAAPDEGFAPIVLPILRPAAAVTHAVLAGLAAHLWTLAWFCERDVRRLRLEPV